LRFEAVFGDRPGMQTATAKRSRRVAPSNPITDAIDKGFAYLASVQSEDGALKGDYGGPLFLLPGYVFAHYATQTPLPDDTKRRLIAYIGSVQNPDGGFGLHIESKSYVFTTTIQYVALRLMGVPASDPVATKARNWLHAQDGAALGIPSWGKLWLAVLRLYSYEGMNPLLPELWAAPTWLPMHPSRMWCHSRVVYLPMSYLYGRKWSVPDAPVLADIRTEIFNERYSRINWKKARDFTAASDRYAPKSPLLTIANLALNAFEKVVPKSWREQALEFTLGHIKHESETTSFIDIGPVNKVLDTIASYAADPTSEHTKKCIAALPQYLFDGEDGVKMQGYNSSELWDTAFMVEALAATGRINQHLELAQKAFRFIDDNQVREDVPEREKYYRDPSKGGWPFSNKPHGWPIVDCTAEGLKAVIALEQHVKNPLGLDRLRDSVDLLLFWQNDDDGGWATYEKRRGSKLLELINPSDVFGDIMVDYSYVELSSSAMQGLVAARDRFGAELGAERLERIDSALHRGEAFLRNVQRTDGSFEGSWAVCFTYGAWFGITGLRALGVIPDDLAIAKAVAFLLSKQNEDGGWGESYLSSHTREYVQHADGSQIVMTAWALLALINSGSEDARPAIARGVQLLLAKQLPDGDWPKEGISGVFSRSCMIHYRFYRNYFPLWALGLAQSHSSAK